MLGLGNTLTASDPIEGIIQLGTFTGFIFVGSPNDENVTVALAYSDTAINSAFNIDGVSEGEKTSGTLTLTVTRLDSGGNPVAGATTTGEVYGYKGGVGVVYISDTDQSSFDVAGGDSDFNASGAALIDITSFGDVTDITDNSVSTSNYTATVTLTAPGYTSASVQSSGPINLNTA
jgi:hypothetical protein